MTSRRPDGTFSSTSRGRRSGTVPLLQPTPVMATLHALPRPPPQGNGLGRFTASPTAAAVPRRVRSGLISQTRNLELEKELAARARKEQQLVQQLLDEKKHAASLTARLNAEDSMYKKCAKTARKQVTRLVRLCVRNNVELPAAERIGVLAEVNAAKEKFAAESRLHGDVRQTSAVRPSAGQASLEQRRIESVTQRQLSNRDIEAELEGFQSRRLPALLSKVDQATQCLLSSTSVGDDDLRRKQACNKARKDVLSRSFVAKTARSCNKEWKSRQRRKLRCIFTSLYGTQWLKESSNLSTRQQLVPEAIRSLRELHSDCDSDGEQPNHPRPYLRPPTRIEMVEAISSFLAAHPDLSKAVFESTDNQLMKANKKLWSLTKEEAATEKKAASYIQDYMDKMAMPLYSKLNMRERQYQDLVNFFLYEYDEDGNRHEIQLPGGTKMPRWPSIHVVRQQQKEFLESLGLEVSEDNKVSRLDPAKVLQEHLRHLHKSGLLDLRDGKVVKVQLLGDATGIFKSLQVNGTVLVLKVIYNAKKVEGQGVNTIFNQRAFAFYLGDDDLHSLKESIPDLDQSIRKLVDDGVVVDLQDGTPAIPVSLHMFLGGDLKFLNAVLGLGLNSGSYPCPFCTAGRFIHKPQCHLTRAELDAAGVLQRTIAWQQDLAHLPRESGER